MAVKRTEDDGKGLFGQPIFKTIITSDDGLVVFESGKRGDTLTIKVGEEQLVLKGDMAKRHAINLSDLGIL